MKKMRKSALRILLCLLLALTSLAGCSSKDEKKAGGSPAGGSDSKTESTAPKAPLKIKMINRMNAEVNLEDNPYLKEVEKQANVKLEIEAPPLNNYNDRLKIVMASGDYPDIVYVWLLDSFYETWAKEGLVIPLDDKVSKYPNLTSNVTKGMWEVARVSGTGKIHGVPKPNKVNYWGYVLNQKWMDTLGLKVPKTIDDFYEVAKAIATKDPDGNGKADTYAISPFGLWYDRWFLAAFNLNNDVKGIKDFDGNYKVKEKFEDYYTYLTFMRKLYAEKLIDPEFFLNKVANDQEKFKQERIGFCHAHEGQLISTFATVPDALSKFTFQPSLTNKKGEAVHFETHAVWGAWTITNKAKDVDGILKFLDWGNSKEGFTLMNIGVKDIHYEQYDGEKRFAKQTDEQKARAKTHFSSYTSIAYAFNGLTATMGDTAEKAERYNKDLTEFKKKVKNVTVPYIKAPKLDLFPTDNPDLVKKKEEQETKYVVGDITLEQLKNFIDKEYLPKVADAEKEYIEIAKNIK